MYKIFLSIMTFVNFLIFLIIYNVFARRYFKDSAKGFKHYVHIFVQLLIAAIYSATILITLTYYEFDDVQIIFPIVYFVISVAIFYFTTTLSSWTTVGYSGFEWHYRIIFIIFISWSSPQVKSSLPCTCKLYYSKRLPFWCSQCLCRQVCRVLSSKSHKDHQEVSKARNFCNLSLTNDSLLSIFWLLFQPFYEHWLSRIFAFAPCLEGIYSSISKL